jgi:hypothetical protein
MGWVRMPQLDLTTYFGQFLSFSIAFCVLYMWIVMYYLPVLKRSIGLRSAFLQSLEGSESSSSTSESSAEFSARTEATLRTAVESARTSLSSVVTDAQAWSTSTLQGSQTSFQNVHGSYADALAVTQQAPAVFQDILGGQSK